MKFPRKSIEKIVGATCYTIYSKMDKLVKNDLVNLNSLIIESHDSLEFFDKLNEIYSLVYGKEV